VEIPSYAEFNDLAIYQPTAIVYRPFGKQRFRADIG